MRKQTSTRTKPPEAITEGNLAEATSSFQIRINGDGSDACALHILGLHKASAGIPHEWYKSRYGRQVFSYRNEVGSHSGELQGTVDFKLRQRAKITALNSGSF